MSKKGGGVSTAMITVAVMVGLPAYWISSCFGGDETEKTSEVAELTEKEILDSTAPDHGYSSDWSEPEYIGKTGYVVAHHMSSDSEADLIDGDWVAPTYYKDRNMMVETDTPIPHKTKFTVVDQDLTHEGHGCYAGYLTIKQDGSDETTIIKVSNYANHPFFEESDLIEMAKTSDFIAEYHQVSDEYPFTWGRNEIEPNPDIPDGSKVLVAGWDSYKGYLEGLVYGTWANGTGYVRFTFNPDDLTYIY